MSRQPSRGADLTKRSCNDLLVCPDARLPMHILHQQERWQAGDSSCHQACVVMTCCLHAMVICCVTRLTCGGGYLIRPGEQCHLRPATVNYARPHNPACLISCTPNAISESELTVHFCSVGLLAVTSLYCNITLQHLCLLTSTCSNSACSSIHQILLWSVNAAAFDRYHWQCQMSQPDYCDIQQ